MRAEIIRKSMQKVVPKRGVQIKRQVNFKRAVRIVRMNGDLSGVLY